MSLCDARKTKSGAKKGAIETELLADPEKHEQWARSIEMRYRGSKPKEAPMPLLSTDGKRTEEEATEESTCGEWIVPLKAYAKNPQWGEKLELCRRKLKRTGKEEDCVKIFSTTMLKYAS